jgi:hypothetical protein
LSSRRGGGGGWDCLGVAGIATTQNPSADIGKGPTGEGGRYV